MCCVRLPMLQTFFRRTISLMKEYNCKNGGECKDLATCKRCRMYKCLKVGMNPRGVCPTKLNKEQVMAFAERMKEHPRKNVILNTVIRRDGEKQNSNFKLWFISILDKILWIRAELSAKIINKILLSLGLSDQAQKLLCCEAEKYSALLMNVLQTNYGPAAGALRYVELLGLIECLFNAGAKHRQLFTYISNVLDPNFDKVFPPVLAKICTKGPVESHQLFPY
ncbi:hypothetical protein niasHT_008251 [Heterodera trifolii]|uniref:Nuclear receptor domain-containing protein n=1 Tax=Heterodera trifolii TaxID=157864 RepID=A0ABD2M4B4_9BILA